MDHVIKTLRLKVKPEAYPWLDKAAREVNFVWNWAAETSMLAATRTDRLRKWMTGFDLNYLSAGATTCFERIGSDTIQRVSCEYATKRRAVKKLRLSWRKSGGSNRSLGWVPFKAANLKRKGNALRFAGKTFRVFGSDRMVGVKWRDGCFAQDSLGCWWLSLPVSVEITEVPAQKELVGIDLGLKAIATTSDGDTLAAGMFYRDIEQKVAQAQRRGHKRQAKRLHRRAVNRRKDALHKFSRRLVNEYQNIIVGDVSSAQLAKTRMAKSVFDSGWGMLKAQLHYKGQQAGRTVEVVNERNTTRACSSCGCLTGPSGLRQLVVRAWRCSECGSDHDRDVNAARNIAMLGSRRMTSVCGNESHREVMA